MLNPDVLYIENGEQLLLTFATLDDKLIYQVDELAKDIFFMSVNDFTYEDMLQTCLQTGIANSNTEEELLKLLNELIKLQILTTNDSNL